MSRVLIGYMSFYSIQNSAYDPDPLDPQNFGFLDPVPQKYADLRGKISAKNCK